MKPFIKWAGGKARLLPVLTPLLPVDPTAGRYWEPFLGGGAMFFHLLPPLAVLSDVNVGAINAYRHVRDKRILLCEALRWLKAEHAGDPKATYLRLRDRYNSGTDSPLGRAALFLYLNKAGFNGLYRENREGKFNVPKGSNDLESWEPHLEISVGHGHALRHAVVSVGSFHCILPEKGDFVYLDPPYLPTNESSFTAYNKTAFGVQQHVQLADFLRGVHSSGARFMLSNADTPLARALYSEWRIDSIEAPRTISANGSRAPAKEIVVRNY